MKIDLNPNFFEKIYPKLLSAEISIKYDVISTFLINIEKKPIKPLLFYKEKHLREQMKRFSKALSVYKSQLHEFIEKNSYEINLERAKFLINS